MSFARFARWMIVMVVVTVIMWTTWLYLSPRYSFVRNWGADGVMTSVTYMVFSTVGGLPYGRKPNPYVLLFAAVGLASGFEFLQLIQLHSVAILSGTFDKWDFVSYLIGGLSVFFADIGWIRKE
jgi:hypothetical protein